MVDSERSFLDRIDENERRNWEREQKEYAAIIRENAVGSERFHVSKEDELRNVYTMTEQRRQANDVTQDNTVSVKIQIPPYGRDTEYEGMIKNMLLKVGNSGIKLPTKTTPGEIESSTLAMFCHNNKKDYGNFATKLKSILPYTTFLNVGGKICDPECIYGILDNICAYKGKKLVVDVARTNPPPVPDPLALYHNHPDPKEGGRRSKSKTKTKNNKYKNRRTNKVRKNSRSRIPKSSRRYRKSRK